MPTKRVSELTEGQWITYGLEHTPNIRVTFICEYGKIEGYVFTTLGDPTIDGFNLYLAPDLLDQIQANIERNGGSVIATA